MPAAVISVREPASVPTGASGPHNPLYVPMPPALKQA